MANEVHPGSFVGDTVEEFKKLPTWGKVTVVAIGGVLAYVGYAMLTGKQSSTTGAIPSSSPAASSSSLPTSGSQSPAGPFPGVTSGDTTVPFLPSNVNPVYSAQGQLEGYQSNPSPTTSTAPTASTSPATPPYAGYAGLLGPNAEVNFKNYTYKNAQGQSTPLPIPSSDKLVQGSQNRVWYTDTGGQHLLTSGIGPNIDPTTNQAFKAAQGGGGMSFQSGLRKYTLQYGDNLHTVASQLRIKGGLPAWLDYNNNPDHFYHGQTLEVPPHV